MTDPDTTPSVQGDTPSGQEPATPRYSDETGPTPEAPDPHAVKTAGDGTTRLADLKKEGRSNALFYVANAQGDMRYVTLPVE